MTGFSFTPILAVFLLLGAGLGAIHFLGLALQVRALARRGGLAHALLPLARFPLTVAGFVLAAKGGAAALLVTMLGFLLARALAPRLYSRRT